MQTIARFAATALIFAGLVDCEQVHALADGYYDGTWNNGPINGRIVFQGDEIGDDPNFPPSSFSEVNRIFVGPGGDLILFGATSSDTWIGGLHADGSWILTFGHSNGYGRTTTCSIGACNRFGSAAVQADGRYLVLGSSFIERTAPLATSLYNINTASFAVSNIVGGRVDAYGAVAVQADGNVLVGGSGFVSAADGFSKFGVARLASSTFALDSTFNDTTVGEVVYSGGAVSAISGAGGEAVSDILVQPDGRIVLVGSGVITEQSLTLELARLNANGTLDPTFGSGGVASFTWPSGTIGAVMRARLDRAGRIVVALQGAIAPLGEQIMVVARVTADGHLDGSFGADLGFARFSISGACAAIYANAVDIDSAGRILVAGTCSVSPGVNYFVVLRLRGDGYIDGSFGINGYGLGAFAAGQTNESAVAVAFDASGHPVVGGKSQGILAGISRLTYDLVYTNNFELVPRGCLPPDCIASPATNSTDRMIMR